MKKKINSILDFYKKAEKLKSTTRDSWLTDSSRQESVAEHSWMICLLAMLISDEVDSKTDLLKVLKMLVVHDLAEAITGDIPSHEISKRQNNKKKKEKQAFEKLTVSLSQNRAKKLISLWEEFEKNKTPEANLANAIDKVEATMQHNLADISTWSQGDFNVHPYYKNHLFDFDPFIRAFKDVVDDQSMKKLFAAGKELNIDSKHLKTYKNNKKRR